MELSFRKGLTAVQIGELIQYSNNDELIRSNTKDSFRFADKENFDKWMNIPRKVYTLTNNTGSLLGIIWFRAQELALNKEYGITFAIRIYGEARGKGYSEKFLNWSFDQYYKTRDYLENPRKKIWLETRSDNAAAIKLYEKFGFITATSPDENNRIIMTQS